jgi:hypothetical protein
MSLSVNYSKPWLESQQTGQFKEDLRVKTDGGFDQGSINVDDHFNTNLVPVLFNFLRP